MADPTRQLWAFALAVESGYVTVSPATYYQMMTKSAEGAVYGQQLTSESGFYTPEGPVRIIVVPRMPDGLIFPSDDVGNPLFSMPWTVPWDVPKDWPSDWEIVVRDMRNEIRRGRV